MRGREGAALIGLRPSGAVRLGLIVIGSGDYWEVSRLLVGAEFVADSDLYPLPALLVGEFVQEIAG